MTATGIQAKPSQPSTEGREELTQFLMGKLQEGGIKLPEAKAPVAKTESAPAAQGKGVVV